LRGNTVVGNAALIEQNNIIPHLARAYLDKREVSKSRFNSQLQQPKNKNYHPDTLIKKLIDYQKKPDHLLTLAATGGTTQSSLVKTPGMQSRSPSPMAPVNMSAHKPITIQIDFPRGTPTPKINLRSHKASVYDGNETFDKPNTPGVNGMTPSNTGSLWYLKRGDGNLMTGGGFSTAGT